MVQIPDGSPVRRLGWLSTLPSEFAETVLSRSDVIHRRAGEALYQVGDEGAALFGIVEGRVEVHVQPLGETPTLVLIVGPGFWTGEMAAVAARPRIISLVARNECRLLRLSRAELLRITQASPETWRHIAMLILGNLGTAMSLSGGGALRRSGAAGRAVADHPRGTAVRSRGFRRCPPARDRRDGPHVARVGQCRARDARTGGPRSGGPIGGIELPDRGGPFRHSRIGAEAGWSCLGLGRRCRLGPFVGSNQFSRRRTHLMRLLFGQVLASGTADADLHLAPGELDAVRLRILPARA